MANDPYWNSVVLAMHMDDTGLTDLKGHAVTLTGNVARSSTQSKFGGYSAYFDGAGDFLYPVNSGPDFAFGTGDFTVEMWVYLPSLGVARTFYDGRPTSTNGPYVSTYVSATNTIVFLVSSVARITGTTALAAMTWYHVALCRSGTSTKLFLNGVQEGATYSDGNNYLGAANRPFIGIDAYNSSTSAMLGYIDDLRVTKGVARYTANFTPSTDPFPDQMVQISGTVKDAFGEFARRVVRAYRRSDGAFASQAVSDATTGAFSCAALDTSAHYALTLDGEVAEYDPYWSNVVLAMHMDGANGSTTFTDLKGVSFTASGGARISTGQSMFGGASLYLDGAGDYLDSGNISAFGFGTGALTVELFVRVDNASAGVNQDFLDFRTTNTARPFLFGIGISGKLRVYDGTVRSSAVAFPSATWQHIAFTRQANGTCTLFQHGVPIITFTDSSDFGAANSCAIGRCTAYAGEYFAGYMDDLRITKGVARYTSAFTPPAAAFPHGLSIGAPTTNALIFDNITPV